MKTSSKLCVSILTASLIILSSCEKKDTHEKNITGMAQFSFSLNDKSGNAKGGGTDSTMMSYQLMVSVEDMNGNPVITDQLVPVYVFGSGFMSEKIQIKAGEYNLTKFLVIDPSGQVIYASPLEGSPLAYITNDPLPVQFSVLPDQVTSVVPEVLVVGNYSPGDFGYASFGRCVQFSGQATWRWEGGAAL